MGAPGDPVAAARDRVIALLTELGVTRPLTAVGDHVARLGVVQGVLADRVLDLAVTESGRLRITAELRGRRWAADRGVGAPAVLAAADDGRWLVSRRIHSGETRGERWTGAAIEAAVRIAPLPVPPGEPWAPPSPGRTGRARTSVQDAARLLRGGVRAGELRAVLAAARELPRPEVVHGDFRAANAVLDEEADRLVVLEWAGVRAGPRHRDLLTLWATTPDDGNREGIAGMVLERTSRWERPDVGLLWHAVALEQLVERVTRPDRGDRLGPGFARSRLSEARRMAVRLGSRVGPRP